MVDHSSNAGYNTNYLPAASPNRPSTRDRLIHSALFLFWERGFAGTSMSDEAVAFLRTRGREARRLDGGLPEWRRAGLPIIGASVSG